ncbi:MAG TPA: FtsX-like permease family protein [Bryobacteraceae bacterium]|nr:FtsX-like permease family protein [Bryobacteraceae bacterium]
MILLRLISWPYVRKHLLRSILTAMGIVLGVAVFVGMHTANQSVLFAFQNTVDRIAGTTQLQVTSGETGFDEDVLDKVQSLRDVRVASPVIEAVANTGLKGQGSLLILGVDMTGDRGLRDYNIEGDDDAVVDDPLVFLAQPDSIIVTTTFAHEAGLHTGSKLPMSTMQGERMFTVRGIMKSGGLASAFGGNLAVMDIYAAQRIFGRGRKFDRIDVAVKEGTTVEAVRDQLRSLLGPGFEVAQPSARGQQFESLSRAYSISANVTSAFALFIGMFIIYNTFQISVAQRRPEIGILRALGATRNQIRALFLAEGAVAGLVGSFAGVGVGLLLARGMTAYLGGLFADVYGVAQRADDVSTSPLLLAGAVLLGMITSIFAAWLPARNAARVDPVNALQKGRFQQFGASESRVRRMLALVLIVLCAGLIPFSGIRLLFYASDVLSVFAALLLTPTFALLIAQALRPVLRWLRPVEGTLAADSLLQSPRRTSGAVAALMLSLALVVALGGLSRGSFDSIYQWMSIALNPDLFVTPTQNVTDRSFHFPDSMGNDLRAIPGIAEVQAVRNARIVIRSAPIMFVATDVGALQHRATLPPVAGDAREMYRLTSQGKGVLASENFALLRGYKLGEIVDIPTPSGLLRLPIVGIVKDFSDQQGTILIDRSLFERDWHDSTVNVFRVYLRAGATEADVKRAILERFGNQQRLFVFTNRDLKQYILNLTNQWFGLTYIQIAVAVLVAVLGIVNTLTVSITDRRRELGVLQAVGGMRNQIRHTIWLEALSIGTIGLLLGLGFGAVQLFYCLNVSAQDIAGLNVPFEYPYQIALLLLPVILVAAFISALGPAESAVRGSLVEALEYE